VALGSGEDPAFLRRAHELVNETSDLVATAASAVGGIPEEVPSSLGELLTVLDEFSRAELNRLEPEGEASAQWDVITGALRGLRVGARAANSRGELSDSVGHQLSESARALDAAIYPFADSHLQYIRALGPPPAVVGRLEALEEALDARRLLRETRGVRDEALRVLDVTRHAAGVASETVLGTHFSEYAASERGTANVLRFLCSLVLIALPILAGVLVFQSVGDLTAEEEITRLAVGLPLAALAAYFGRESSRHRQAARWAQELSIKLRTLDAFVEPLAPEDMSLLRTQFGRGLFWTAPNVNEEQSDDAPSAIGDGAKALARAADALGEAAGRVRPTRN
jgi:hypothetical protein